jgi:6,7-dimethyl-8-ribityllumazine synthase
MTSSGGFWPGEGPVEDEEFEEAELDPRARGQQTTPWHLPEDDVQPEPEPEPVVEPEPEPAPQPEPEPDTEPELEEEPALTHRPGEIDIPSGVSVIEGAPFGNGRSVGIVVARYNSEISNALLESALEALVAAGVAQENITVMPVPGAFELPIGAMALAKTRRYSCVVGLGCVIRGETPHFDFVASEAASGLQLAGLETGVPVTFGVLTVDSVEQAKARLGKGGEAARSALEMADVFSQVRARVRAAAAG